MNVGRTASYRGVVTAGCADFWRSARCARDRQLKFRQERGRIARIECSMLIIYNITFWIAPIGRNSYQCPTNVAAYKRTFHSSLENIIQTHGGFRVSFSVATALALHTRHRGFSHIYPSAVDRAPAHPRALIELVGRRLSGADRPAVLAYNVQRLSKKTEDTRICTSYDRTHTLSLNSNDIGERTTKRASRPQPAIYVLCAAQRTRLILRDPSSGYVGTVRTHQIPGTQQAISWQTTLMSVSSPRSDHLCVVAAHPHTHTKQLGHLP